MEERHHGNAGKKDAQRPEGILGTADSRWQRVLEQNKAKIENIYHALEDELSKKLYRNLLELQYTGDVRYLMEAVRLSGFEPDPALLEVERLRGWRDRGRELVLYGLGRNAEYYMNFAEAHAGTIGYYFFPFITTVDWSAYCDKDRRGTFGPDQKRILSPEEMMERYPDALICVVVSDFERVKTDLMEMGVEAERIVRYVPGSTRVFDEQQYFDNDFMHPRKERFFVDGGAFHLETAERCLDWNQGHGIEGILSYEPDPINAGICRQRLSAWPVNEELRRNSAVINAGLSDQPATMNFLAGGTSASHFRGTEEGVSIPLVTVDETVGNRFVSFIKLDVEGFELQALKGAEKTVRRCRPRMAVCAYHRLGDLLELPQWILDVDPSYQMRLRMYSNEYLEIVLYAQ